MQPHSGAIILLTKYMRENQLKKNQTVTVHAKTPAKNRQYTIRVDSLDSRPVKLIVEGSYNCFINLFIDQKQHIVEHSHDVKEEFTLDTYRVYNGKIYRYRRDEKGYEQESSFSGDFGSGNSLSIFEEVSIKGKRHFLNYRYRIY